MDDSCSICGWPSSQVFVLLRSINLGDENVAEQVHFAKRL